MKREGWILIIVIGLFFGAMIGLNVPFYITGLTTGNVTYGNVNAAPVCVSVPNQSWSVNTQKTLNLSEYCLDTEGRSLVFNATSVSEVAITISNGIVTFAPNTNFVGSRVVTFSAFDYVNKVYTNNVTLTVSGAVSEEVSSGGVARVVAEAEGEEEIILYLAPTIEFEKVKEYYLEDYFVEGIALLEDIEVGSIIYLGSEDEENLAYVQVALIEDGKALVNFVDLGERLLQLEFLEGDWFELDEDRNGLNEYVLYADYIGEEVVDLRFVKVEEVSFSVYTFVNDYWFVMLILMVILVLVVLISHKKI